MSERIRSHGIVLAFAAALLSACPAMGAGSAPCPSVGAIRWDAWFGDKGVPGLAVEKSLGPSRWHDRLPTCARALSSDAVRIVCDSPQQMSTEIDQAVKAGLSYWAFVAYSESDPMSAGLRTYLQSPDKTKLRFALISALDKLGDRSTYNAVLARYVRLMADPSYQMTGDGRPLFFLGFVSEAALDSRFGGRVAFAAMIDEFRATARKAGLMNPYIVLLEGNVPRGRDWVRDLRLDALSAYAVADNNVRHGAYMQLATIAASFWSAASAAGVEVVPTAMTGWDRRPRVLNPVPWERGRFSEEQMERYFAPPTAAELEAHVAAAVRWAARPGAGASVLIYAWNEFDEGGWLAPTLGEGGARLEAVRRGINAACAAPVKVQ